MTFTSENEATFSKGPKKDVGADYEARNASISKLSTSWRDNPYSQGPNEIDTDEPDFARDSYLGDKRIGLEHASSVTPNVKSQRELVKEDASLWPQTLKGVSINTIGGRPDRSVTTPEDHSLSLAEKPASPDEAKAVLNMLVKGVELRTKRHGEIASRFTPEEVEQVRTFVYNERSDRFMPKPKVKTEQQLRNEARERAYFAAKRKKESEKDS